MLLIEQLVVVENDVDVKMRKAKDLMLEEQ
jgi:hypothetical protein